MRKKILKEDIRLTASRNNALLIDLMQLLGCAHETVRRYFRENNPTLTREDIQDAIRFRLNIPATESLTREVSMSDTTQDA